jgi:hypothetical protein
MHSDACVVITTREDYAQFASDRRDTALLIRDNAYNLVDRVIAAMTAQTAPAILMAQYGKELVCARTVVSQKGLGSVTPAKRQELHQTVADELTLNYPYATSLIDQFYADLLYYLGARGTGVLNNRIGAKAADVAEGLLGILPADTVVTRSRKTTGKIKQLAWMQGNDRHVICFDIDFHDKNLDIVYSINDQTRAVAEVKAAGDHAGKDERFASALDVLRHSRSIDPKLKVGFVIRCISNRIIDVCRSENVALFPIDAVSDFHRWLVS